MTTVVFIEERDGLADCHWVSLKWIVPLGIIPNGEKCKDRVLQSYPFNDHKVTITKYTICRPSKASTSPGPHCPPDIRDILSGLKSEPNILFFLFTCDPASTPMSKSLSTAFG